MDVDHVVTLWRWALGMTQEKLQGGFSVSSLDMS
jgi:hypothetical protein